jgi:hypothetical protein
VKTKFALCLAVALSAPAIVSPASAQYVLPPHEITTSVRSMGLRPISAPVLRANGQRYVVRAVDGNGLEIRVVADSMTGRVIVARPARYHAGPAYAARPNAYGYYPVPGPGYEPEVVVRPPRDVPRPPSAQQSARAPVEPPDVIYAPGSKPPATASKPQTKTAARPPAAAKSVSSKVAAKPAKPAESQPEETAAAPKDKDHSATTGSTSAAAPGENSSLDIPPVQSFE